MGKTDQTHWHTDWRGGRCNFNSNMGLICTPCLRNIYYPEKGKNRAFIWRNAFVEAFPSLAGCGRGQSDLPICKMNGYLNSFPNNFSFLPNLSKPKRRVIINFLLGNSDSYHLSRTSSHMNFNVRWKNKWYKKFYTIFTWRWQFFCGSTRHTALSNHIKSISKPQNRRVKFKISANL